MKILLAPPHSDDLIRLLKAWRFWFLGAVAGALIGTAVYLVAPPPYRGQATVNVDFHMEQAWPENSDREQFYYLEREARKLEEIALSDAVIQAAASRAGGGAVQELRLEKLRLSQPGNGGWHFYALDRDPRKAAQLASAWAGAFVQAVQLQVAQPSSALERFITADTTRTEESAAGRTLSLGLYMMTSALALLALSSLAVLFFAGPE